MSQLDDATAQHPALLNAWGVVKNFPGVKALQDMHLELRHGEVHALVGENGAGKSTLMKLLAGSYSPDEGHFLLNGEPLEISGPRQAQECGISIIHQEFNLIPDLTIAQNIFIGREPRSGRILLRERALNAKAQDLIDSLHLPLDPKQIVGTLTVAKQQMVEIAKALSYDARVLIMDEPTAALNDAEVRVLHDLIRRFVQPTTGVIYISHRLEELRAIADRITVIRDGRYIETLDAQTATTRDVISRMVGRELVDDAKPENVHDDREILLSVRGMSTKTILKDVSFDLMKGEILGFAGLMGAGRTEVARALIGADKMASGTVRLRGKRVDIKHPADAAKHRIGYLSEDRKQLGLLVEQDVKSNIALSALRESFQKLGFVKNKVVRQTSERYVKDLRIKTPSVTRITKNLSGGNQQKVVIAKWLAKDCDVLIFDEPTRGIDVGAKEEIYRLLNELTQQGKSIIMISSELPEVLRLSHRVVVMSEGSVTGVLSAGEADEESVMHLATLRSNHARNEVREPDLDASTALGGSATTKAGDR